MFLPTGEVEASDEYSASDPYSVETGITGDFQRRRIECTLEIVGDAAKRIQRPPKVLDLGCGQGHITAVIKKQVPGAEVYGLDYSISAIRYANSKFPGIEFVVASAYHCPYRAGSAIAIWWSAIISGNTFRIHLFC